MALRAEFEKIRQMVEEQRKALDEEKARKDRAWKRSLVAGFGIMVFGITAGYFAGSLRTEHGQQ